MSERDLTRPTGDPEPPPHGSAGPADPHADPATDPALRPAGPAPGDTGPASGGTDTARRPPAVRRTRSSALWVGLILSALVLIFLLIFILQNNEPVRINFLALSGTLPSGVALLLAAVAGVLLVAIPGSARILQLRRAARRGTR
jgi:uncharacterized integral membrane protein